MLCEMLKKQKKTCKWCCSGLLVSHQCIERGKGYVEMIIYYTFSYSSSDMLGVF